MHYKTRAKLLKATKVYLTEKNRENGVFSDVRIQLPTDQYVLIDLDSEFPKSFEYKSLSPKGFDYDEVKDPLIIMYGKSKTISILEKSIQHNHNNPETTSRVLELVKQMKHF